MILRGSYCLRVDIREASPSHEGGVTLYRWQGLLDTSGSGDGWGKGLWLSWDEWESVVAYVEREHGKWSAP